jgi:C-terminal processing protease CtpA/Prc
MFLKKAVSSSLAALLLLYTGVDQRALASDAKVLNEAWKIIDDYYLDSSYNNNDWKLVQKEYTEKALLGGDESMLIKKMVGLLGDKYTRLLDKQYFRSLFKYDAIGIGLLLQSEDKPDGRMVFYTLPHNTSTKLYEFFWSH